MAKTIHCGFVIAIYSALPTLFPLRFLSELGMRTVTRWALSSRRLSEYTTQ